MKVQFTKPPESKQQSLFQKTTNALGNDLNRIKKLKSEAEKTRKFTTPVNQRPNNRDDSIKVSEFGKNTTNQSLKQSKASHKKNTSCSAFKGSENGSAQKTLNMRDFKRFKFVRNICDKYKMGEVLG